jgi:sugar/nucleoside kinase (ribokinase family)
VEDWPEKGGLIFTQSTDFKIGGVALNAAVTVAKLGGMPVGLIGHIGNDRAGQVVCSELEALGVRTTRLTVAESKPTGVCIVCVHPDGERSFLYCGGANNELSPETADVEGLDPDDYLHIGGALGMAQLNGDALRRLVERVQNQRATVSVDTAWDGSGQWWTALAPSLPFVDIFTTNSLEAERLTGSSDPAVAARKFAAEGPKLVVVKMGGDGSYVLDQSWEGHVPVFRVETVDTTGAGDAFCGSLLYGLARGWNGRQAATFANAVGALCVTATGATDGIRSYVETVAFIREQGRAGDWDWGLD